MCWFSHSNFIKNDYKTTVKELIASLGWISLNLCINFGRTDISFPLLRFKDNFIHLLPTLCAVVHFYICYVVIFVLNISCLCRKLREKKKNVLLYVQHSTLISVDLSLCQVPSDDIIFLPRARRVSFHLSGLCWCSRNGGRESILAFYGNSTQYTKTSYILGQNIKTNYILASVGWFSVLQEAYKLYWLT